MERHGDMVIGRHGELEIRKICVHPVKYKIPKNVKINAPGVNTIYMVLTPRLALFNRVHQYVYICVHSWQKKRRLDEGS